MIGSYLHVGDKTICTECGSLVGDEDTHTLWHWKAIE